MPGEYLWDEGEVDFSGNLVGNAYVSRMALGEVLKEKQQLAKSAQPAIRVPERVKPASGRTANLTALSSLKELLEFLLANFGEKKKYQYWVTPEELCDIIERYQDILQAQWHEGGTFSSTNMTWITLYGKGQTEEYIELHGLFPFSTESEAKKFCYDKGANLDYLFGQLEGLWGIHGKNARNFSGDSNLCGKYYNRRDYRKENDIEARELWKLVCRKLTTLGFSPDPQAKAENKWWMFWK